MQRGETVFKLDRQVSEASGVHDRESKTERDREKERERERVAVGVCDSCVVTVSELICSNSQ